MNARRDPGLRAHPETRPECGPEIPDRLPKPPELRADLPPMDRGASERSAGYRRFGLAYTIPTALIAPVLVLTFLGAWLDGRFGSGSSGFTIGGAVLGLVVGTINMLRLAARLDD